MEQEQVLAAPPLARPLAWDGLGSTWALARRKPLGAVGAALVLALVVLALAAPLIAPYDYREQSRADLLKPPSAAHLFGTDNLGRDVLSRVIVGARSVLVIALLATVLGTVVGTTVGLLCGYFRGIVDEVIMRVVDAILAIPVIITAGLAVVAVGQSQKTLVLVIGFVFSPIIARTVRAAVLGEAQLEYVQAARLRNEGPNYVMFAEILPNVMGPVIVEFTVRLGYAIFTVATLSFLGFGADPSIPDWGHDISEHYVYLNGGAWWPVLFPALAIGTLIVGINLIADAIAQSFER